MARLCGPMAPLLLILAVSVPAGPDDPKVLLYHSFDRGLTRPDHAAEVTVEAGKDVCLRDDGVAVKAVGFPEAALEASIRIEWGDGKPIL